MGRGQGVALERSHPGHLSTYYPREGPETTAKYTDRCHLARVVGAYVMGTHTPGPRVVTPATWFSPCRSEPLPSHVPSVPIIHQAKKVVPR